MSIETDSYETNSFDSNGRWPHLPPTAGSAYFPSIIFGTNPPNTTSLATKSIVSPKDLSGKVDVTVSWGGSEGVKTEVSVSGGAKDDRGNSLEVSATRDNDGKTSVTVSGEHASEK